MLEIIKSLTGKQKFIAVLVITLISSTSSILTMYFKTDDCKGISDQYTALVRNQMDLMNINNKLIAQYNNARRDLQVVNVLVDNMDSLSKIVKTEVNVKNSIDNERMLLDERITVGFDQIYLDSIKVASVPVDKSESSKPRKIEKNKTIIKTPIVIKNYIDSINKITSKY